MACSDARFAAPTARRSAARWPCPRGLTIMGVSFLWRDVGAGKMLTSDPASRGADGADHTGADASGALGGRGGVVLVSVLIADQHGLLSRVSSQDSVADRVEVRRNALAKHVHICDELERHARQELHVDVAELHLLCAKPAAKVCHAGRRADGLGVRADLYDHVLGLFVPPAHEVAGPLNR